MSAQATRFKSLSNPFFLIQFSCCYTNIIENVQPKKNQRFFHPPNKRAINIKLQREAIFTWPWLCKSLYGLPSCFILTTNATVDFVVASNAAAGSLGCTWRAFYVLSKPAVSNDSEHCARAANPSSRHWFWNRHVPVLQSDIWLSWRNLEENEVEWAGKADTR